MKQNSILFRRFTFRGRHYVCLQVDTDRSLNVKTIYAVPIPSKAERLPKDFLAYPQKRIAGKELSEVKIVTSKTLSGQYYPAAESPCQSLDLITPDSMDYDTEQSLLALKKELGDDLVSFACSQLHCKPDELRSYLSAEQVDAVCMAIRAIRSNGGFILGDQTGVGKGRVAAAIIRYAVENGQKPPLFFTIKPNLFSDLYRDLTALGCSHYRPYIVNKTNSDILDANGKVVYRHSDAYDASKADYILCTYSQINSEKISKERREFISRLAQGAVCILDESHSASGASSTTEYMYSLLASRAKGVLFMSATFAKRPDNMLLYCSKTKLKEAFDIGSSKRQDKIDEEKQQIETIFKRGGVPLQEYVSGQLVAAGQMLRRERSFKGVQVEYLTLDARAKAFGLRDYSKEHYQCADKVTDLIRKIIHFQNTVIQDIIDTNNQENKQSSYSQRGRREVGMRNSNLFSRLFHIVDTFLFSLKTEATVDLAISRIGKGEKVIIAFSKTNESLLDSMGGDIKDDLSQLLLNALESTLYVTTEDERVKLVLTGADLEDYKRLQGEINSVFRTMQTYLPASPIDYITDRLEQEGIAVAELTGRSTRLVEGKIKRRESLNVSKAFQDFNNNLIDVLLINQTASTGASAHAIPTDKVPIEKVKRRCMIVLQSELDINTEIQKRGRINRTGQVLSPLYIYLYSAIPAEKRLSMMMQAKLKSLDANTTSSQKNTEKNENVQHDDFINKYGDYLVVKWLLAHSQTARILGFSFEDKQPKFDNIARQATGRVAILPTSEQEKFYNEILQDYNALIGYLKSVGQYDLEMDNVKLDAKTLRTVELLPAKQGYAPSELVGPVFLEECEVNNLQKPYNSKAAKALAQDGAEQLKQRFGTDNRGGYHVDAILQKVSKDYEAHLKSMEPKRDTDKGWNSYFEERSKCKESLNTLTSFLRKHKIGDLVSHIGRSGTKNCIFSSIQIGEKVTPETIKIRFLVADETRSLTVNAESSLFAKKSQQNDFESDVPNIEKWYLNDFYDVGGPNNNISSDEVCATWDKDIAAYQSNRVVRYIITGSLLRAYNVDTLRDSISKQQIISYTTLDGEEKKGFLCSKQSEKKLAQLYFKTENEVSFTVREVKLNSERAIEELYNEQRLNIFRQFDNDTAYRTPGSADAKASITIHLQPDGDFEIIVSTNKKSNAYWILKDEPLIWLTVGRGFYLLSRGIFHGAVRKGNLERVLARLDELGCYTLLADQIDEERERETWARAHNAKGQRINRITPILALEIQTFGKSKAAPYQTATVTNVRDALARLASAECADSALRPLFTALKRQTNNFTKDAKLDRTKYSLRSELRAHDVQPSVWLRANKTIDRSDADALIWLANQLNASKGKSVKPSAKSKDYDAFVFIANALALKMKVLSALVDFDNILDKLDDK